MCRGPSARGQDPPEAGAQWRGDAVVTRDPRPHCAGVAQEPSLQGRMDKSGTVPAPVRSKGRLKQLPPSLHEARRRSRHGEVARGLRGPPGGYEYQQPTWRGVKKTQRPLMWPEYRGLPVAHPGGVPCGKRGSEGGMPQPSRGTGDVRGASGKPIGGPHWPPGTWEGADARDRADPGHGRGPCKRSPVRVGVPAGAAVAA